MEAITKVLPACVSVRESFHSNEWGFLVDALNSRSHVTLACIFI